MTVNILSNIFSNNGRYFQLSCYMLRTAGLIDDAVRKCTIEYLIL